MRIHNDELQFTWHE